MTRPSPRTVAAAAVLSAGLPSAIVAAFSSPPRGAAGRPARARLGVSLEEEAAAFDVAPPPGNGTVEVDVVDVPPRRASAVPPAGPPLGDTLGDAAGDAPPMVLPEADSAQDQLSELLADPALLDPVGVLGATIGLPLPEEGPDGGDAESEEDGGAPPVDFIITASSATAQPQFPQVPAGEVLADASAPPLPAEDAERGPPIDWDLVQVEPEPAAESREEDLELTLRAILGHIAGDDGDSIVDDDDEEETSVVVEAFLNEPPSAAPAAESAGAETLEALDPTMDPSPELESPADEPLRRMDEILQQAELISESLAGADGEAEAAALLGEAEALEREAGELLRSAGTADTTGGLLEETDAAEEVEAAAEIDDGKQLENDLAEGSRLIEDELRLSSPDGETASERGDELPRAAVEIRPAAEEEALHAEAERVRATSLLAGSPTVLKILRYTVPAIGIWLCGPVLSMIDTAAVGLLGGTAQQAALNPAVSVTDYGALVVAFMYTATTNLVAAAVQEDEDDPRDGDGGGGAGKKMPRTTSTLVAALRLAAGVGVAFGAATYALSAPLLRLLIGNDGIDPEVFGAALRYVRVRALGMPAAVTIGTAQSASLGMQDVRSPLYVLGAAALVNLLGDVALVPRAGSRWFGGAAGAAWATVASQYAALVFFAGWMAGVGSGPAGGAGAVSAAAGTGGDELASEAVEMDGVADRSPPPPPPQEPEPPKVVNLTKGIMELTGSSSAGRSRRREFSRLLKSTKLAQAFMSDGTPGPGGAAAGRRKRPRADPPRIRGFLSGGKVSPRSFLSPSATDLSRARDFLPFVVPVTTTSVGRISGYIAMSHVASSTLGTHDMAAHQIIFSIFCCLTPIVDALSQVAQSFVPAVFESRRRDRDRADALRRTVGNFRRVGVVFGGLLVSLVACIPLVSRYFTTDPMVLSRVRGALPGVGMFLVVNGLMCAGEGALLGQKDLKFLRNMYAIFFFTVPAYMLRLKNRARLGVQEVGIGTMWAAFSAYNLIRTSTWHLRLAQLQRRTDREVVEKNDEGAIEYDSLQ